MKVARRKSGFTLIELLVVISILGILAGLAVPALKNLGKSDANISAARQLLDDVGRARQFAIANHTTVYMVFVTTNFWLPPNTSASNWTNTLTSAEFSAAANLADKQLSGYSFISHGTVGDQPGQHNWHYLLPWQSLPEGTFIAAQKFQPQNAPAGMVISQWVTDYGTPDNWRSPSEQQIYGFTNISVPFPTENAPSLVSMPCIAFDYSGKLVSEEDSSGNYHDAYIPLARGSVSYGIDPSSKTPLLTPVSPGDISEIPPGNSTGVSYSIVHIYALTGRAVLEYHKVQ